MSMYYCNEWENFFDEDELVAKRTHIGGPYVPPGGYYETDYYCPHCGSDNFEEAQYCEECGNYFVEDELIEGTCKACLEEIVREDPETVIKYLHEDDNLQYFAEWLDSERKKAEKERRELREKLRKEGEKNNG